MSVARGGGVDERWGFKHGFKPLFSLVRRCRWNVLCVKKKINTIKSSKKTKKKDKKWEGLGSSVQTEMGTGVGHLRARQKSL